MPKRVCDSFIQDRLDYTTRKNNPKTLVPFSKRKRENSERSPTVKFSTPEVTDISSTHNSCQNKSQSQPQGSQEVHPTMCPEGEDDQVLVSSINDYHRMDETCRYTY